MSRYFVGSREASSLLWKILRASQNIRGVVLQEAEQLELLVVQHELGAAPSCSWPAGQKLSWQLRQPQLAPPPPRPRHAHPQDEQAAEPPGGHPRPGGGPGGGAGGEPGPGAAAGGRGEEEGHLSLGRHQWPPAVGKVGFTVEV